MKMANGGDTAEAFYTFSDVRRTCLLTITPEEVEKYGQKKVKSTGQKGVRAVDLDALRMYEQRWKEAQTEEGQIAQEPLDPRKSDSKEDVNHFNVEEPAPGHHLETQAAADTAAGVAGEPSPARQTGRALAEPLLPKDHLLVEEERKPLESDVPQNQETQTGPRRQVSRAISFKHPLEPDLPDLPKARSSHYVVPHRSISFKQAELDADLLESSCSGRVVSTQHAGEARFTKPKDVLRLRRRRLREPPGSSVNSVALTFLDGDFFMAAGTDDGITKIWLVSTGELLFLLRGHEYGVLDVVFSNRDPRGEILVATASADSTAKIWSLSSGQLLHTLRGHDGWVRSVAFSPQLHDNKFWLVSGSDNGSSNDQSGAAKLWRVNGSECEWSHSFDAHVVSCTAFGPQVTCGMAVFAISSVQESPQSAKSQSNTQIWNASPLELLSTFRGHSDVVTNIAFSDTCLTSSSGCTFDELLLATCSWDKTAKVWKAQSGELLHTLCGHDDVVSSVSFGPRCRDNTMLLATGSWDGTAKLWNSSVGLLIHTFEDHADWVNSVLLQDSSKEQALLVTGSRDTSVTMYCINLHQLSKKVLRKFDSHRASMCCGWNCTIL